MRFLYPKIIFTNTIALLIQAVALAPSICCAFGVVFYKEQCEHGITTVKLIMFMLCLLVTILAFSAFIYLRLKIKLLPYIIVTKPRMKIIDAIKLSFTLMRKNTLRYLVFKLSFIKYIPFALLAFPCVIIFPYYIMSMTVFMDCLLGDVKHDDFEVEKFQYGSGARFK